MNINCSWLTNEKNIDLNLLPQEIDEAYTVFINDFIASVPKINGYPVYPRRYPEDDLKHRYYSFNHITSKDYDHIQNKNSNEFEDRAPDIRRIERIAWIREFIEHPKCIPNNECHCKGMLLWYEPYKNTYRINLMIYEENFQVVLEKATNKNFYLIVTAFYFDTDIAREKRYKKYLNSTYIPATL